MENPWKIFYRPPDKEREKGTYGLYRRKDASRPDTPENRVIHKYGFIFGDSETARRAAEDFNGEEEK